MHSLKSSSCIPINPSAKPHKGFTAICSNTRTPREKLGLLLDDLATADEADLKLTHAWDWVVELKKRHAHFIDIYQKRLEHASYIDPGAIKIARQKTEKACKSVNALLEASSLKHDSQTIAQTIERLNASIDAQKNLFKQQESQNEERNHIETIEDIDMDDDEMA